MSEPASLLLLDRVWPPFRDWIRGLIIAAVAVGSFGLFQLAMRDAAPSDPCRVGDGECASSDSACLSAGLVGLGLAVVLGTAAGWLAYIRHRMLFMVPPGWPLPPPGWRHVEGWEPHAAWPAPPESWEFWRRPRSQ